MNFSDSIPFSGRETLLKTLRATLEREQRVVLSGPGSSGKTAVAREYVRRYASAYQTVCWLDTATDETFLASTLDALQTRSVPVAAGQTLAELFQKLHKRLSEEQQALLILENLPFGFALQDASEQRSAAYHLLVITQSASTPAEIPRLEIGSLDEREGALLLLRRSGVLSPQAEFVEATEQQHRVALELARELHGQPLALTLAGAYLKETGVAWQEYLFAFRDYPDHIQPAGLTLAGIQEIMVVCGLSLTHLQQANPAALELVQFCASLALVAIPDRVVQQLNWRQTRTGDLPTASWQAAVQALLAYGFVCYDQETATLCLAPLLQTLIRQFFALAGQQNSRHALLLFHPQLSAFQTEPLPTRLRIAGHILYLSEQSETWEPDAQNAESCAEIFSWAASLLWEQRMVGPAEALLRRALLIWEQTLGTAHPTVATLLVNLATLNALLKNYSEAEALSHRAIASKSTALGAGHPDVLLALNHLGHVYAEQEKYKEARLCYGKAISIGQRVNLVRHPFYTDCQYDLARLYIAQEQFDKAEPLLRRVCLAREFESGPQDPASMAARLSLAEVAVHLKKWPLAESSYLRVLPLCEKLLGADHPVTLLHLEHAATAFLQQGKLDEAESTLQRVLAARERAAHPEQGQIVACLNGLARLALARQKPLEAQELLERARTLSTLAGASETLAQAELLDTLTSIETALHHPEQALAFAQSALDLRTRLLGAEHLDLVENLSSLGQITLALGNPRQAEEHLLQALFLYQQAHKPEDLALDPVLSALADIESQRGRTLMARMYLERARAIRELFLGHSHPRTADLRQKLLEISGLPE